MTFFEFLAEVIIESVFHSVTVKIYEGITGKGSGLNGYRTEQKKFIKFNVATKFLLTWETDIEHLKNKISNGLELINENLHIADFQFKTINQKTIIQPPASISFYAFHFLVQSIPEHKIKTVGVVKTARTIYTVYNEPDSENLIGQTDKGKKFFITLLEDYSKKQFLRINRGIETIDEFEVQTVIKGVLVDSST